MLSAEMEHDKILELYQIAAVQSLDLKTAGNQKKEFARTVAGMPSAELNI